MGPVGVLALQGDFEAHAVKIRELGRAVHFVRCLSDLNQVSGLVMPGGESTSMLRLLSESFLLELCSKARAGFPILATCAGAILIAKSVSGPSQRSFDLIDIDVNRNAYGRQVDSFVAKLELARDGRALFAEAKDQKTEIEGVFIRAPKITRVGAGVQTLLNFGCEPVLVKQGNVMAATFHPELSKGILVHGLFLDGLAH